MEQYEFIKSKDLKIIIDLIKDIEKAIHTRYYISTVNGQLIGEIDSIYVDNQYRKIGLGDEFMKRALECLDCNNVKGKKIAVVEGNESVLDFYERHGFHKRQMVL